MNEAPETITIRSGHLGPFVEERWFGNNQPVEYVRVDRFDALELALRQLLDEKCDYMIINHLGDPEKEHTVKLARAALRGEKI